MTTIHNSHSKQLQQSKPHRARGQENMPKALKGRPQVTVDIPSSAFHRSSTMTKATPTKGDGGSVSTRTGPNTSISGTLKRKLEVFVDIPPSPFHGPLSSYTRQTTRSISDTKKSISYAGPSLKKSRHDPHSAKSKHANPTSNKRVPVIEIPVSRGGCKGSSRTRCTCSHDATRSPLSSKMNMDFSFGPMDDTLYNKLAKEAKAQNNDSPSLCHQCRGIIRKLDGIWCSGSKYTDCSASYCSRCLNKWYYSENPDLLRRHIISTNYKRTLGQPYSWICPQCHGTCKCYKCMSDGHVSRLHRIRDLVHEGQSNNRFSSNTAVPSALIDWNNPPGIAPEQTNGSGPSNAKPIGRPKVKRRAPEPKWIQVRTELTRGQVEDRFYLREFFLRFSPLMNIAITHLEDLDVYETLSEPCAKALLVSVLDLIAADAEGPVQTSLKETIKWISTSKLTAGMLWTHLKLLRTNLQSSPSSITIPDPSPPPPNASATPEANNEEPEKLPSRKSARSTKAPSAPEQAQPEIEIDLNVKCATQLMPPLIALCEWALQGESIREEFNTGSTVVKEARKAYFAALHDEHERWAKERATFGDVKEPEENGEEAGKKKGKKLVLNDAEKKSAYEEAVVVHKKKLADLEYNNILALQGGTTSFSPLGTDAQGRVYYAASVFRRPGKGKRSNKVPSDEERTEMKKWSWFLAVWTAGNVTDEKEYTQKGGERRWFGFVDPVEIRKLAKWIRVTENLDEKDVDVEMTATADRMQVDGDEGRERPPTRGELKALVKKLIEYADLLAWRIAGGADT